MQIIVLADDVSKEELKTKKIHNEAQLIFIEKFPEVHKYEAADAYFFIKDEIDIKDLSSLGSKPILINSTIHTLKERNLPENFCRINGWPGFLNREIWEIATRKEEPVKDIFRKLEWKYTMVTDEPGLVSARIISMIINEAYFALGEDVSTKEEIDIAMKLGTNYPYGPFEWSRKIGLDKIYSLLEKLSKSGSRYKIAPAMKEDLSKN